MTSYVPAKKGAAFIAYVALMDYATSGRLKANPTLAAGDVKVSIDGGAFANLATLPAVTPASGKAVKVSLSSSEMNGDNILVVFSDQTDPPQWNDLAFNIQTAAHQIDDLATATDLATVDANVDAIKAKTDNLPSDPADESLIIAATDAIMTRLGAPAGASVSADVAAVKSDTGAIKAKTDNLPTDPADASDVSDALSALQTHGDGAWATATGFSTLDEAAVRTAVGMASADLDTQLGAIKTAADGAATTSDVDARFDTVDTNLAAVKAKTDNLPADPADASVIAGRFDTVDSAIAALPSADDNAAALLDAADAIETSVTVRGALRGMAAILLGKVTGGQSGTEVFRAADDSKDRVTSTNDSQGNRSAVTLDLA